MLSYIRQCTQSQSADVIRRNKAVANGAVCYFLEHFVSARVMKMTYGTQACVDYDRNNAEHIARRGGCFVKPSGRTMLPDGFSSILKKVNIYL